MESFGVEDVQMYLGDGNKLLTKVIPRKSVDIAIVDNHFESSQFHKLEMYAAIAGALKSDGIMVAFDSQRGWEDTVDHITDFYHILSRYRIIKKRPMRATGETRTNWNVMNWLTPDDNESGSEWKIGFIQGLPMTKENRLKEDWVYNSSDQLGRIAGCASPHHAAKGIGFAGFLLTHLSAVIGRSDIVVADPYGGSGTFAIASKLLGMKCYSSEIDKKAYDNAKTKFFYAMGKAKKERTWFKSSIKTFRNRIVG